MKRRRQSKSERQLERLDELNRATLAILALMTTPGGTEALVAAIKRVGDDASDLLRALADGDVTPTD